MEFIENNSMILPPDGTYIDIDQTGSCTTTNKVTAAVLPPIVGLNTLPPTRSFAPEIYTFKDDYGYPVEGLNIRLASDSSRGVTTDKNGQADLSNFGVNDELVISHISLKTITAPKSLIGKETFLQSSIESLDEVIVTAGNDTPVVKSKKTSWAFIALVIGVGVVALTLKDGPKPSLKGAVPKKKKSKKTTRIHV